jgi:myosin-light-chain kinase
VKEEIGIMNILRNKKIMKLEEEFERKKEVVMVMEYISGGELFERVVEDDFKMKERE